MGTMQSNVTIGNSTAGVQSAGLVCASMVQDLVEGIASGSLKRNERLPSEQEFSRKYGISVTAVRRGMEILVREGLLSRRRGSGTYVNGGAAAISRVRGDTILICRGAVHPPTHPYFGHIYPRLISRLAELEWKVSEFHGQSSHYDASQTEFANIDAGRLPGFLGAHPNIAGAILHRVPDEFAAALQGSGLPCVALGAQVGIPSVDYDWETEFSRAIGLAMKAGAQRVWALCSDLETSDTDIIRMASAMTPGTKKNAITLCRNQRSGIYSQTTYDACEATRAMLRASGAAFDGIAIASDFHAQGVLDALMESGTTPDRCPIIVALVNKESRIHTNLPLTALVANGAALGAAAAELLHRRITDPQHAPESVVLGCTIETARRFVR